MYNIKLKMSQYDQVAPKVGVWFTRTYYREFSVNSEGKEICTDNIVRSSDFSPERGSPDAIQPYQWHTMPGGGGICMVPDYYFLKTNLLVIVGNLVSLHVMRCQKKSVSIVLGLV